VIAPGFLPFTFDGISPDAQRQKKRPLTGSASVSYDFTPETTGYVSYSRSFRPGVAGVGVPAGLSDELSVTGPERSDQYEIGLKGALQMVSSASALRHSTRSSTASLGETMSIIVIR
jgi:outer membrane receptor protein involved in Fe transport